MVACGVEHLAELQQLYRERPFVNEELWTAKIDRAIRQNPYGLNNEALAKETGLNLIQIEAAAAWRLRGEGRFGAPEGPSTT
ncbi:hypothetical protein [Streptomyces sp. NPDC051909]|uniref:hypothetical protein n=1 Tax=Streptomyces sp. NPDC051909 TaxID=3154944 RepID=UPI003417E804